MSNSDHVFVGLPALIKNSAASDPIVSAGDNHISGIGFFDSISGGTTSRDDLGQNFRNTAFLAVVNTTLYLYRGADVENNTWTTAGSWAELTISDLTTALNDIAANTTAITANDGDIATNVANIASSLAAIQANDGEIATLQTNLATEIATTDADVTSLQGQITSNDTELASHLTQIQSNDTDIAANVTDITNLQTELDDTQTGAGLGANGAYTANAASSYLTAAVSLQDADNKLDAQLNTNTSAIATNASGITTNASGIATNLSSIQSLQSGGGGGSSTQRTFTLPTGNNDYCGDVVTFGSTSGNVYYPGAMYYWSGGAWVRTLANSTTSSTLMLGIALEQTTTKMLIYGTYKSSTYGTSYTSGRTLYVAVDPTNGLGKFMDSIPSNIATGSVIRTVGYMVNGINGQILFDPSPDYITVS